MSLVEFDSWPTECESVERLGATIASQLSQREARQRLSQEYQKLTTSLQGGLKQFYTELRDLKEKLAQTTALSSAERERRQQQVAELASTLQELQSRYNQASRSERAALLGAGGDGAEASPSGRFPWQVGAPTSAPVIDLSAFKQSEEEILEEQNRGLQTLAQTISRQRQLALQFGQEVEDQNDILDNLANNMERVDGRLGAETGNLGQVNRRDSTWGYWLVIIVLFVAILLVSFL